MTETSCCIAGGGPAGMMLGLLLARRAVDVVVLEKHEDFFRDFRGDTVHPSTLRLLDEMGLADSFLYLPHQKVTRLGVTTDDGTYVVADFARLPGRFRTWRSCRSGTSSPSWRRRRAGTRTSTCGWAPKPWPSSGRTAPSAGFGTGPRTGERRRSAPR